MNARTLRAALLVGPLLVGCSLGDATDGVFGANGGGSAATTAGSGGGTTTATGTTGEGGSGSTTGAGAGGSTGGDCGNGDASWVCIPAPPGDTIAFLTSRPLGAPVTDCGALGTIGSLGDQIQADASGCACACDAPAGGQCSGGATLFQYGSCSGGAAQVKPGCFDFSYANWVIGGVGTVAPAIDAPGGCAAIAAGAPTPATFGLAIDRCVAQVKATGCAAGEACTRRPPIAVPADACVEVAVGAACPAGYPNPRTHYEGLSDERACDAGSCSCDGAKGQTCSFAVELFDNGSCSGNA